MDAFGTYIGLIELPGDCVSELSAPGPRDAAAAEWAKTLGHLFNTYDNDSLRREIKRWGVDDVDSMDRQTLIQYALWLLSCNAAEDAIQHFTHPDPGAEWMGESPCPDCGTDHNFSPASDEGYSEDDVFTAEYVCGSCGYPVFKDKEL